MTTKDKKKQYESFVSPKGAAVWPKLNAPDTEYKAEGEYHTKLAFDPSKDAKVQAFLDELQARFDSYVDEVKEEVGPAKAKKLKLNEPFTQELDAEGEETGRVLVKFKMKAQYKAKDGTIKTNKPRFFDAKGNPLGSPPNIGSDSVLKISYSIAGYNTPQGTGISLYLNAVQIVELKEWNGTGGNAKSFGFTEEEDGYVGEAAAAGFTSAADEEDEESSEDF